MVQINWMITADFVLNLFWLLSTFVRLWRTSMGFKKVSFNHVPQEKNKIADKLVNQTIDASKS